MSTTTTLTTRHRVRVARVAHATRGALPALALLAVTVAWGSTFVLLHDATTRVPAADYLAVRFGLAALVLGALRPRGTATMPAALRGRAVLLGVLFGAGNLLQTVGLAFTSPSVSGFVTGMYVVLTPLFGALLLGDRIGRTAWAATALATAGLGTISLNGAGVGAGELLTLGGAALFALHIIALGRWSDSRFAVELAVVQSATTAVLCTVVALPGGIALPQGRADWLGMIYTAVVVGAVTILLQTWAQARLHPARAAVIMTMEPVWAAAFAIGLGVEAFGWRLGVGGGLVLIAMYLSERTPRRGATGDDPRPAPTAVRRSTHRRGRRASSRLGGGLEPRVLDGDGPADRPQDQLRNRGCEPSLDVDDEGVGGYPPPACSSSASA